MPRRACSVDANQGEIADAFRRLGWDVIDTHQHAQFTPGFPDLIVICGDEVLGIEVKMPGGTYTKDEWMFRSVHQGWQPIVVRTVDDVLELSGMVEEVRGE